MASSYFGGYSKGGTQPYNGRMQASRLAQEKRLTHKELLVSRESFLNLIRAAIDSVGIYADAYLAGKDKDTLETLNGGMNLQVVFVQAGVEEKLKTKSGWDKETVRLGRALANDFAANVQAQKRQVQESGVKPDKRVKGFFKRMETYADAIQTALIDPGMVAKPQSMRYVGPSGAELDRRVVEQGDKIKTGASSLLYANHKHDEMVDAVDQDPDKFVKEHEQIGRSRAKKHDDVSFIPSNAFNFDLDESLLEDDGTAGPELGASGRDKDKDGDLAMADKPRSAYKAKTGPNGHLLNGHCGCGQYHRTEKKTAKKKQKKTAKTNRRFYGK